MLAVLVVRFIVLFRPVLRRTDPVLAGVDRVDNFAATCVDGAVADGSLLVMLKDESTPVRRPASAGGN